MTPSVSIVVPTFNRPQAVAACIAWLDALDYPRDRLEIIIVDDGSDPPVPPELVQRKGGHRARLIRQANRGPASARNAGANAASGELLVFTDDDCTPDPGWITALANVWREHPGALIGGTVINAVAGNIYSEASQDLVDFLNIYFGEKGGASAFFTSNNIACGRDLFVDSGGFDESFRAAAAEDREIAMRWQADGRPLRFVPGAVVRHHHQLTFRRFWRQHANYGRGALHLHRILRARAAQGPRLEPLSFYLRLVGFPLRRRSRNALPRAALMLLSQAAMTSGYFADLLGSKKLEPWSPRAKDAP